MNYIKKKLKSHKKEEAEEEEEYEKAVYEQSLKSHSGEQTMKDTEEWQFFQQLSMKVQDTVQKTQTTLSKLKDIRQDSITNKEEIDLYLSDDMASHSFLADEQIPSEISKVAKAPPRPPPPSSDKNWFSMEPGAAEYSHGTSDVEFSSESQLADKSALHGTPSPARPPPPVINKNFISSMNNVSEETHLEPLEIFEKDTDEGKSVSLLDMFGFDLDKKPTSDIKSNYQDLLLLDDKEESDPFDTSFVDVTNVTKVNDFQNNEISLNPFSSGKDISIENSNNILPAVKKTVTNPFFKQAENKSEETDLSASLWSTYNPFGNCSTFSNVPSCDSSLKTVLSCETDAFIEDISKKKGVSLLSSLDSDDQHLTNDKSNKEKFLDDAFICETSFPSNVEDEVLTINDNSEVNQTFSADKINEHKYELHNSKPKDVQSDGSTLQWNLINEIKKDTVSSAEVTSDIKELAMNKKDTVNADILNFLGDQNMHDNSKPADLLNSSLTEVNNDMKFIESKVHEDVSNTSDSKLLNAFDGEFASVGDYLNSASGFGHLIDEERETDNSETLQAAVMVHSVDAFSDGNQSVKSVLPTESAEVINSEFDAFSAKFESAKENQANTAIYDPFSSTKAPPLSLIKNAGTGFGSMDEFDPFKITARDKPTSLKKEISQDSFDEYDNETTDFSVIIKPKIKELNGEHLKAELPKLLPPPKTPTKAFDNSSPRFNPFNKDSPTFAEVVCEELNQVEKVAEIDESVPALGEAGIRKADSIETPLSPLFDEDTSQPLEEFPKAYTGNGWEMVLRQPNKKKLTGNRFWKKIFIKLSENSVLQLYNKQEDKLPFQELPLQACYSLSEIGAQQYDQYGKIFTVKLQYKFYRERVGVRPGQISKVTQGQVTTVGDVAKLGLPLQHSPQTSQLLKLGSHSYTDIKVFIQVIEDALFHMVLHRDRVLTYKTEEIQVIAQDEFYVEQSKTGHVEKQLARVRVFFLAFITGMPSVEVGLNDINREGKEVVGRYDIIPVVTEEWIRLEDCEFHACVMQDEFQKTRIIKFQPPDACLYELLRFRIRPPRNRELPLQVRVFMTVTSSRVEIRSDILVPGYSSRKQGQIPCENIQIRFPVPECWIYLFRTEKHFRYGSKKSAARRPGKIKGLERIIGAAQNLDPSLIEVSAGQAKYEHVFHAVVWRIPRLPKEGQGAYTQQLFLLRTELTSFDQIPETFDQYVDVEFTMPATYVSHTTVRSVSVSNPNPPEKYVKYISKHEYKVEIDFKSPDDIDSLASAPDTAVSVTTGSAIQESTDEKEDESD